jgi:glycosyltransferase involved in cell wall biosynthesis
MMRDRDFDLTGPAPSFSVVVPFFNEYEGVGECCRELKILTEKMAPSAEIILIDDGSTDGTAQAMDEVAAAWPQCRVYHLPKNGGQSAALLFGFKKVRAPVIVTMDGDGQNDPRDIPRLLVRLEEADMVVGIRTVRHDSWARRRISRIANLFRSYWLRDGVSDAGCALKVFRREVADSFIPIRTIYSFMPALAVAAGFRVVEEPVNHRARRHGKSRYSVRSFLLFPIIDFIGLAWFRWRRCDPKRTREPNLAEELARRMSAALLRRFFVAVGLVLAVGGLALLIGRATIDPTNPESRRISLSRAEKIARRHLSHGRLAAEELRWENSRLFWEIDVELPASAELHEIDIDAHSGEVISTRRESAAEEALEVAAEDHASRDQSPAP